MFKHSLNINLEKKKESLKATTHETTPPIYYLQRKGALVLCGKKSCLLKQVLNNISKNMHFFPSPEIRLPITYIYLVNKKQAFPSKTFYQM